MFKFRPIKEQFRSVQKENLVIRQEAEKNKSIIDYIAACDYPEVFEEEETDE